ncbi:hypothetical protein [Streptomyces sp. NPDC058579]|uniref:hypothetical protein n=1 Tax=Streptomyces sp. NPDC058579 TaxID=3346548 RepID=UPI00365DBE5C
MSGDSYYFGDAVNQYGDHNQGIVHHHHASPALEQALLRVLDRVAEVRAGIPAEAQRSLDGALPALAPGSDAEPQARRSALQILEAVAGMAGNVGQPLLDATRAALQLLGG